MKALPKNWHKRRNEALRRLGDEWTRAGRTVAMMVPSAAVAGEWNLLLNPAHADFHQVKFGEPAPFRFDTRMFR